MKENLTEEALKKSKELLNSILTPIGFVASAVDIANYRRVFSRDGVIASIAALMTEDEKLVKGAKTTLKTLAKYQHKTGRIASNISIDGEKVSFGTQVGRVDASIWFVIGVGQYVKKTKDKSFAKNMHPFVKKTIDYLEALELNGKGLLYIPYGGDWADEYVNHGYVLSDQLLYLQAQKDYLYLSKLNGKTPDGLKKKLEFLKRQVLVNYIPKFADWDDPAVYQKSEGYIRLMKSFKKPYAASYFVQGDIGDFFDALANILLIDLIEDVPKDYKKNLLKYMFRIMKEQKLDMIPAFYPVITKKHNKRNHYRWRILQFSYVFKHKNKAYHYHNGGLWPLLQGFLISMLVFQEQKTKAENLLSLFAKTLARDKFKFPEYYDGKRGLPEGTFFLGFSASAYIIAYMAVHHSKKIFL